MSGWLRHVVLNAQARTGFGTEIAILATVSALAALAAAIFLTVAAFVWLANRYDAVIAGLVLAGFFMLVALIALVACLIARRRNMERARLELAARDSASDAGTALAGSRGACASRGSSSPARCARSATASRNSIFSYCMRKPTTVPCAPQPKQ